MKATQSVDGKIRTTVKVDFRLTKEDVVNLLATHTATYGEEQTKMGQRAIMELVKTQLRFSGTDVLDFGAQEDIPIETYDWAKEQVNKFWKD